MPLVSKNLLYSGTEPNLQRCKHHGRRHPLVNIGDISKPATVLIEKISDAIGGIFKPYQITRVARAEAAAEVIRARGQIEVSDLQRRGIQRFFNEESIRQANIEAITTKAIPQLQNEADPKKMDNDWIANFFDKCRIISDDEMQMLWAKVLAGEANSPGSFAKRTVNLLNSLDKSDALFFTKLCGFYWSIGLLIFNENESIYSDQSLPFRL